MVGVSDTRRMTQRRELVLISAASLAAALVSVFLLPAITGPDPNAWLTWSRSLLDGLGIDFRYGPAWKPLPVLMTLPLGLLGKGFAAWSWLLIVRFATFWCSGALYLLVRRDAGLLAGLVAAILPFTIRPWVNVGVAGESETLALALVLAAALLHFSGRSRWTVAILTLAGLSRPEVWPLILIYVAWQAKQGDRRALWSGADSLLALAFFWVVGPKLVEIGPGAFGNTSGHSLHDASLRTIVDNTLGVIPPKAWVLIPIGLLGAIFERRWTILLLGIGAGALVVEITVLWALHPPISQTGYTPVLRYFAAAGVLACGVAGQGAESLRDIFPRGAGRWIGTVAVIGLVGWSVGTSISGTRTSVDRARGIARSTDGAIAAVNAAGGVERLKPCFPFTISNYSAISWDIARRLGVPLSSATVKPHSPSVAFDYTAGSWILITVPPGVHKGSRVLGRSSTWAITYYPGFGGCLKGVTPDAK